ncbi:Ube3a [Symbiodinium sp. CCMP2592]|nr:Ube3a [Symbiodinium sp. CCMP2592]
MSTPVGTLRLDVLSNLCSAADKGNIHAAAELLPFLCFCFQQPPALAASFKSGTGLPDFALINTTISKLSSFHSSTGPESSTALSVAKVAGDLMESISLGFCPEQAEERDKEEGEDAEMEAANATQEHSAEAGDCEGQPEQCIWLLSLLAASLPLMADSLPEDDSGICVLPHQHSMDLQNADDLCMPMRLWNGRPVYDTQKICDRCMEAIQEREFYHCSRDCDVDFCSSCHAELQAVLDKHFTARCSRIPMTLLVERMAWTMHVADELASKILQRTRRERELLARVLADEWPLEMFSTLVASIVDVCNAKVLYNSSNGAITSSVRRSFIHEQEPYQQHSQPMYEDDSFWKTIGLLQFLYASNILRKGSHVGCEGEHRPAVNALSFVPEAINQCRPEVEWEYWSKHAATVMHALPNILSDEDFSTTSPEFRCLAAHTNILPINFRRSCAVLDVRQCICSGNSWPQLLPRRVTIRREPELLIADLEAFLSEDEAPEPGTMECCTELSGAEMEREAEPEVPSQRPARATSLQQPFHVTFQGEDGQGPGVRKEFFHVATRAFLSLLFDEVCSRQYWFRKVDRPAAFFAFGALLGHAIVHDVLIPTAFPWTLFDLLLLDMGAPNASGRLSLSHLAALAPEEAHSLRQILDYQGSDLEKHFGELGWERTGRLKGRSLSQASKSDFVNAYIDWRLSDDIEAQFKPFSRGFKQVVGDSHMLRMLDAEQLEWIVSGAQRPVDMAAVRSRADHEGWTFEERAAYLDPFWKFIEGLAEEEKKRFLVFVTASDRMPVRGWASLRLLVQKNGAGDDRLPTAYTCFSLLLLPLYSSLEVLKKNMLLAMTNSEGFGLK